MEIDLREPVQLGQSTQWIRIRAANTRHPLLLLVQQGPGLPMLNEVRAFERLLSLEDDFTVIYWDQRGCGRSLRSADTTRDLSIQTMFSDTERLLAMLCDRFDTPAVVAGSRWARRSRRKPPRAAGPGGDPRRGEHGHRRRSRREERLRVRARNRAGQEEPQGRSAAQSDRATTSP